MADIVAPDFNPGSRLAMFRQVPYGTDDLPGGSDGFDAHTIRSKSVPFHEMGRALKGTERVVGPFLTPD
jgi:hypothetical protein